jgi:hypothetical protein
MPIANSLSAELEELAPDCPAASHVPSFDSVTGAPLFASTETYHTKLEMLFIGCRVCIRRKPQSCGEVVRVMTMSHRVLVRLDPPNPSRHSTLRSFRPERLVIYS